MNTRTTHHSFSEADSHFQILNFNSTKNHREQYWLSTLTSNPGVARLGCIESSLVQKSNDLTFCKGYEIKYPFHPQAPPNTTYFDSCGNIIDFYQLTKGVALHALLHCVLWPSLKPLSKIPVLTPTLPNRQFPVIVLIQMK